MMNRKRRNLYLQFFLLPAIILIAVYLYYPIFDNLYISFFDIKNFNFQNKVFRGLSNYQKLSHDPVFWRALRNTVLMTSATIFIQLPIAFFLADALVNHLRKKHRRLEQWLLIALFLPIVLPTPVYAKAWRLFFSGGSGNAYGFFETIMRGVGIEEQVMHFLGVQSLALLGDLGAAFWVVLAVQTWARIGFNLLIYRSSILSIPAEIYESAEMDGAGPWSKLSHITVPLSRSIIGVTIILAILGVFQLFDIVWLMTAKGGPLNSTQLLATYMYLRSFEDLRPSYGAAIAMMILVVSVSLALIQRHFMRARD